MSFSSATEAIAYYQELLRPYFKDRKFLLVGDVDVGLLGSVELLESLGASTPMLIAGNRGTQAEPIRDDLRLHRLGVEGSDLVGFANNMLSALCNLPSEVRHDIDQWDPHQEALWVGSSALLEPDRVAGRAKFGKRKSEWLALEDKTTIDALWDQLAVARAPSQIIDVNDPNFITLARKLDQGLGTVWAPDNRLGANAGGVALRWIQRNQEAEVAWAEMRLKAHSVRVMPFLEGLPLSIHGLVFPTGVCVLRPVELMVLQKPNAGGFLWAGCATAFDPPANVRAEMREVAKRTGEYLRAKLAYRGPFSIDGILTKQGFLPTELNPRLSGGFGPLMSGLPNFPLAPLCWVAMEDEALDYQPYALEKLLLEVADNHRFLGGHVIINHRINDRTTQFLVRDGQSFREVQEEDQAEVVLRLGPSPVGGIIMFRLTAKTQQEGARLAPEFVRVLRYTDKIGITQFGDLQPPKQVI